MTETIEAQAALDLLVDAVQRRRRELLEELAALDEILATCSGERPSFEEVKR